LLKGKKKEKKERGGEFLRCSVRKLPSPILESGKKREASPWPADFPPLTCPKKGKTTLRKKGGAGASIDIGSPRFPSLGKKKEGRGDEAVISALSARHGEGRSRERKRGKKDVRACIFWLRIYCRRMAREEKRREGTSGWLIRSRSRGPYAKKGRPAFPMRTDLSVSRKGEDERVRV